MKTTLCILLLAASSGAIFAQLKNPINGDPFTKTPSTDHATAPSKAAVPPLQIGILVEYIQVPDRIANSLVRAHAATLNATALRDKLGLMINLPEEAEAEAEVELIDSCYIKTLASQRAKVESIDEIIHPTGYNLPGGSNPKGFQMRPVGIEMEVRPVVSADKTKVRLDIALEFTRFLGREYFLENHKNLTADSPLTLSSTIYQPKFYKMRSVSTVRVSDGDTVLLSIHRPNDSPDKMILVLLRVDILK